MSNNEIEVKTGKELVLYCGKELYGNTFNLDDEDLAKKYKQTYDYLLKNSEKKGGKGLLVFGNIGAGKSAMMRVMQMIFKDTSSKFKWVSGLRLKDLSEEMTTLQIKEMYGYELKMDLYIDDIGLSNDVKRYGNVVNIISEIVMERYDLYIQSGFKTHLSSNLKPSSLNESDRIPTLKSLYGARFLDRCIEMCSTISFNGKSLRK